MKSLEDKIFEMLKMQQAYDETVFKAHGIKGYAQIEENIQSAMIDEIGELNHELKADWCWWKKTQTPKDMIKVLEELADVMHFSFMAMIACRVNKKRPHLEDTELREMMKGVCLSKVICYHRTPSMTMADLIDVSRSYHPSNAPYILDRLLSLIVSLGIDFNTAYKAYKIKNKKNYQRIREGY